MEALQDLWAELGTRLRRFVGRRVNDPHAADDITQDVLLKVQGQIDTRPPEDKLPAWVFAIARNAVIDHYRARAVRKHSDIDGGEAVTDADESESQEAVRGLAGCLARMVERLPEPYRKAMRLADIEGLGQQEVAGRTGSSVSGAKSRIQRARKQLKAMLLDCCRIERDAQGNVMDYQSTERSGRYCGDDDGNAQCGR